MTQAQQVAGTEDKFDKRVPDSRFRNKCPGVQIDAQENKALGGFAHRQCECGRVRRHHHQHEWFQSPRLSERGDIGKCEGFPVGWDLFLGRRAQGRRTKVVHLPPSIVGSIEARGLLRHESNGDRVLLLGNQAAGCLLGSSQHIGGAADLVLQECCVCARLGRGGR